MRAALAITSVAFRNAIWGKPWNRTTQTQAVALAKAAEWMVFPLVAFAIGAVTGLLMFKTHWVVHTKPVPVVHTIRNHADAQEALGKPAGTGPANQLNPQLQGTCMVWNLHDQTIIFVCR